MPVHFPPGHRSLVPHSQVDRFLGRRALLLQAAMFAALPGLGYAQSRGLTPPLAPTPACGAAKETPTPAQTEGPYYTPASPERTVLSEPGMAGTRLRLGGYVLDRACQPVPGALVDLWQADADGRYDNDGYRLRGHLFSDDQGRWQVETIVPAAYPGRTRHIHVKVQAPGRDVLTTQLYFPDEPGNARDPLYSKALLLRVAGDAEAKIARFDFVLDLDMG